MALTMPSWIASLVVPYIVKALQGVSGTVNWDSVIATAEGLIDASLPTLLQPVINSLVTKVVNVLKVALADTADETKVVTDLVNGDYAKALTDLKDLVVKAYTTGSLLGDGTAHAVAEACDHLAACAVAKV